MSIINEFTKEFRIDVSCNPSDEDEINALMNFASIKIPTEYLELIQEKTELEICIRNKKYIRIWGANGCIEDGQSPGENITKKRRNRKDILKWQ